MHAEFVNSREMQPAIARSTTSDGAAIRGRGELDSLDEGSKLAELGEAVVERRGARAKLRT
jgi:hypothetical protein